MPDGRSITGAVTCPPLAISLMCASRSKPLHELAAAKQVYAPASSTIEAAAPKLDSQVLYGCEPRAVEIMCKLGVQRAR